MVAIKRLGVKMFKTRDDFVHDDSVSWGMRDKWTSHIVSDWLSVYFQSVDFEEFLIPVLVLRFTDTLSLLAQNWISVMFICKIRWRQKDWIYWPLMWNFFTVYNLFNYEASLNVMCVCKMFYRRTLDTDAPDCILGLCDAQIKFGSVSSVKISFAI